MNYLQTHNRSSFARRPRVWIATIFVILVIAFTQFFAPHFLPAIFTTIARPFWRAEFSLSSGSLRSPETLLNQNEELKRELADMAIRLETTQSISNENSELKTLLKRPITTVPPASTSSSLVTTSLSSSTSTTLLPISDSLDLAS